MKKILLFPALVSFLFFAACQNKNSGEAIKTGAAQNAATASDAAKTYSVNTSESVIHWEGYKPGKYSHNGVVHLENGSIAVENGKIQSGNFTIDMTSLENHDLTDPEDKAKLEGHLKSGDFFEVEKYPEGSFEITGIEPATGNPGATHLIKGNLTLKGITKSIEVPATVNIEGDKLTAETPEFVIDRTEWKVNFNSGIMGTVGDALIADDVKMRIELEATAQP